MSRRCKPRWLQIDGTVVAVQIVFCPRVAGTSRELAAFVYTATLRRR